MQSQFTIPKKNSGEAALDHRQLYAIGLAHVQRLARRIWTDYNVHDPGITILELLCYALTDLGYRASFPVKDLLKNQGVFQREARLLSKGGKEFDFSEMCRDNSENVWGEHTCKPNVGEKEYREYLKHITHEAMDIGIQSFLFGQVYFQDSSDLDKSKMKKVLDEMRSYAKEKGIEIVIGAQTGNITDEKYLKMFDYIEGGVGIGEDGVIENGPCWSHLQSCWALLWHEKYASKANNVLLHLDWSGLLFDDMSVYARMNKTKRTETLKYLYNYFVSKDMGFLMPMMATLNKDNGGCYGSKRRSYSASNKYTCQDEGIINSLLSGNK